LPCFSLVSLLCGFSLNHNLIIAIYTPVVYRLLHSDTIPKRNPSGEASFQSLPKDYSHCCLLRLVTSAFQSLPKDYSHCHPKYGLAQANGMRLSIPTKGLFPLLRGCCDFLAILQRFFQSLPKDYSHCCGSSLQGSTWHWLSIPTKGLFPLLLSAWSWVFRAGLLSIPTKGLFPLLRRFCEHCACTAFFQSLPKDYSHCHLSIPTKGLFPLSPGDRLKAAALILLSIPTKGLFPLSPRPPRLPTTSGFHQR